MPKNTPRPNDSIDYRERLRGTTITNKKATEFATEFTEGKELASIKERNAEREKVIKGLMNEINE